MEFSTSGLIVLLSYMILMVMVGWLSSKYQNNSTDFWVGGRRFGTGVMTLALLASIMHGGSIISGIAFAAQFGGVAILPYIGFTLGMLVILVVFAKKLREMNAITLPDYMGKRFNSIFLQGFTAAVVAVSSILYLIAQIRGMGFILEGLLGISFEWSMIIGTVIFIAYVAAGGLLAVVWTNIIQALFMWAGLIVLMPKLWAATGGWTNVFVQVDKIAPGWTSPTGTSWTWIFLLSWILNWFVAYATRIELITKVFAAKDSKSARFCMPWTILLVMIFLLYGNMYLGAAARVLVWDLVKVPDQAFTVLVSQYATPFVAGFAMVGIAAAAMSTTDSLLLMSGASVAHDLLRKCYYEPRGILKDEKFYLKASRWTIVVVGGIALIAAFNTPAMLLQIVGYAVALIGSTFFAPLVVGLTMKRVSVQAATASSVTGFIVTAIHVIFSMAGASWASVLHPSVSGVVISFILIFIVNGFTRPEEDEEINKIFFKDSKVTAAN
ncbi:sodium:solute symporter family protein [Tissierella praeacuta]|uniref:sodium:solute symporter family protein n=1 Tax=Tissierella praeacuta TaxID=43131 RepID=UPI003DA5613A